MKVWKQSAFKTLPQDSNMIKKYFESLSLKTMKIEAFL